MCSANNLYMRRYNTFALPVPQHIGKTVVLVYLRMCMVELSLVQTSLKKSTEKIPVWKIKELVFAVLLM